MEPSSVCVWEVPRCDPSDLSVYPFIKGINLGLNQSLLLEMMWEREFKILFVLLLLLDHALLLEVKESFEVDWRELAANLHMLMLSYHLKAVKQKVEVLFQKLCLSLRHLG